MKRRITVLVTAVVMIVMLAAVQAFAAPSGIAVTNAAGLRRVLTNASGGSYYLASDIIGFSGSSVKVSGGKYTLDLNGHKISGTTDNGKDPIIQVLGGELTVKDGAGGGGITYVPAATKTTPTPSVPTAASLTLQAAASKAPTASGVRAAPSTSAAAHSMVITTAL